MNKDLRIKKIESMLPLSQYSPIKKEIKTHVTRILDIKNRIKKNKK